MGGTSEKEGLQGAVVVRMAQTPQGKEVLDSSLAHPCLWRPGGLAWSFGSARLVFNADGSWLLLVDSACSIMQQIGAKSMGNR